MLESIARLADLFISERKIVVGVRIRGGKLQRSLVSLDCFPHSPRFIQHVAQIEVGQGVTRIGFNRLAVMLLGFGVILAVLIEGS